MRLALRFDMRSPEFGAPTADLYSAALDISEWVERQGFDRIYFAEHHFAEDGYCPSPIVQASSVAARTSRVELRLSALLVPLRHPIQTAEELAVLDNISRGRLAVTLGLGYRPNEFGMYGVELSDRVRLLEEAVGVFRQAWTGEPFEFRGKPALVRPTPHRPGGPTLYVGGTTPASARRAARLDARYDPAPSYGDTPDLWEIYRREMEQRGHQVAERPMAPGPRFLHVTHDPDKDWELVGPYLLHQTNVYDKWRLEASNSDFTHPYSASEDCEALKHNPAFAVLTPDECVKLAESLGEHSELVFHPLVSGLPPEIGWRGLHLFVDEVLPRLKEKRLV